VNVVNLTLTVAVVSGAYLAWIYIPLWLDDLDVREALAAGVGQLTSENLGMTEDAIQKGVAARLAHVGYHWEDQVQVPGLGVEPDDVQVERSKDSRVRVLFSKKRLATTRPASERRGVPARSPRVWSRARPKSISMSCRDIPSVVSRLRGENGFTA